MKSSIVFVLCLSLIAMTTADEAAEKKFLKECLDKELRVENKEFKLAEKDLKILMEVVNEHIDKDDPTKDTVIEQKKHLAEIEKEAKTKLPKLPQETINNMLIAVENKGAHCAKKMPA